METAWLDLRQAVKRLRREVGFTSVVVLTLAAAIGVNTAVFTLVHSTLLRPLPYADAERLVMLWTEVPERGIREATSSYANVMDWRRETGTLADLATFDETTLTLTGGSWAEQVSAVRASSGLFRVLGVRPTLGRGFSEEEERDGARVVVLSDGFWRSRFGGSPDAIGRSLEISGDPFTVIGVMPPEFGFPDRGTELWLPQTLFSDWERTLVQRGTGEWRVIARLALGASVETARMEMSSVASDLERRHPAANAGLGIRVVPLGVQVTGTSYRIAVWTLFGAVGVVLLLACANAAHLVLARGLDRGREFAIRYALGASAPRLVRQAVLESLVLGALAGIIGVALAGGVLRLLLPFAPADLPRLAEIRIRAPVLGYAALLSALVGVVFGTLPALAPMRESLFSVLRDARGTARPSGLGTRRGLVVLQFAVAVVLVFGAHLLVRSFIEVRSVDAGFAGENVVMASLSVQEPTRRVSFYEQALREVQAIQGVRSAALIEDVFISGAPSRPITIEAREPSEPAFEPIRFDAIAGDFLGAMSVPLIEGRRFSASDGSDAPPVAMINQTMARRFWPGQSPIGRRFRTGNDPNAPWIEVVGVVGDMRRQGLEREPIAQVFQPFAQNPSRNMNLLVRSELPAALLMPTIRTRLATVDRGVPVYHATTLDSALDAYLLERRFQTFLLGILSIFAVLLASAGIFGLLWYSVTRHSHEIGVRAALGASTRHLVAMVVRDGLALAVPGLVAGTIGAVWLAESMATLLYGTAPGDPVNLAVPSLALLVTALAASWIPARRAAGVDPAAVLRSR